MFLYIDLKSIYHNFYYKGHCENLERRLLKHNMGMTHSIKPYVPFRLVYKVEFDTREQALAREAYLKTSAGRRFLINNIAR